MHEVEEPRGLLGLVLVPGRGQTLDELTAPVGPAKRPPLNQHIAQEGGGGDPGEGAPHQAEGVRGVPLHGHEGENVELGHGLGLVHQPPQPSDIGGGDGETRHQERPDQGEKELEEVRGHHSPETREPRVEKHQDRDPHHREELGIHAQDLLVGGVPSPSQIWSAATTLTAASMM